MVFSSLTFLYLFLPVTVVLYYICKNHIYRNTILLIASLFFYTWGEPKFVIMMLLASLIAYVGGILIDIYDKKQKPVIKKISFIITTILLVANLFVFKYLNFAIDNINLLLTKDISIPQIVLPIGISFYTFQILSYVFDLYKKEVEVQKNYFYLTLYVSFFPQLIAGPIVRYKTVEEEILTRKETFNEFVEGLKRFILGLAKKVIIANNVASISVMIYEGSPEVYGTFMYWIAAIAYALQIYFDFSGYSDMAIGLGKMFGFHFLENFNYPYIARSITDFWRRWHISLSTWFRDYIYIPMGGNRVKKGRFIFNILTVWALTGFWHGAQWNFIIWGVYYGVWLLFEKLVFGKVLEKLPKAIQWIYSMFFVLIGWVLFNLTDSGDLAAALGMMFSLSPTDFGAVVAANADILTAFVYIPLGIIFMLPVYQKIKPAKSTAGLIIRNVCYIVLLLICITYTLSSTYNPFIYFRF